MAGARGKQFLGFFSAATHEGTKDEDLLTWAIVVRAASVQEACEHFRRAIRETRKAGHALDDVKEVLCNGIYEFERDAPYVPAFINLEIRPRRPAPGEDGLISGAIQKDSARLGVTAYGWNAADDEKNIDPTFLTFDGDDGGNA